MSYAIINQKGRQTLQLDGSVTIRHAQDLAALLARQLEEGTPVLVDAARLEDIDTCILQLLCSLRATVPALTFSPPDDVLAAAADRCGLRRALFGSREGL